MKGWEKKTKIANFSNAILRLKYCIEKVDQVVRKERIDDMQNVVDEYENLLDVLENGDGE